MATKAKNRPPLIDRCAPLRKQAGDIQGEIDQSEEEFRGTSGRDAASIRRRINALKKLLKDVKAALRRCEAIPFGPPIIS